MSRLPGTADTGRRWTPPPGHVLSGIGALVTSAGLGLAVALTETSGLSLIIAVLVILGVGIGIFSTPSTVVVMSAVDSGRYGMEAAAKKAGISISTLSRWMELAEFQEKYRQARRDSVTTATTALQRHVEQ